VINLGISIPDFGPPLLFKQRLQELLALHVSFSEYDCYADSRGLYALRNAITNRYFKKYGIALNAEKEILITHGAVEAIWLTVFSTTNPGDEVLIPDPSYMIYESIVKACGRIAIKIPTYAENGFVLSPNDLKKAITKRSKLLLLDSPVNPTGVVYSKILLQEIIQVVSAAELYIMHDEVFDDFTYKGDFTPLIQFDSYKEKIIMVNSFSKRFGMTGWRIGWLVACSQLTEQILKVHTFTHLAMNHMVQRALADVVNSESIENEIHANKNKIHHQALECIRDLNKIFGFHFLNLDIQAGMYIFPEIKSLCKKFIPHADSKKDRSTAVAKFLLEKFKIAVVPGSAFGQQGVDYIRISIATSYEKLQETVYRLTQGLGLK